MLKAINGTKELFLSIFFPRLCYGCGEAGGYLCSFCKERKVSEKILQACHVCKKPVDGRAYVHEKCGEKTSLNGVIVALKYEKFLEHLITEFKYEFVEDLKFLLSDFLEKAFRKFFVSKIGSQEFTLTSVPLHLKRERWRGYNQSEKLAEIFAKKTGLRLEKILGRKKFTKTQVGLKRRERLENVKEAFEINPAFLSDLPRKVLIVDDVMTTGSTLEECAKVLKEGGVKEVYGLVIARG